MWRRSVFTISSKTLLKTFIWSVSCFKCLYFFSSAQCLGTWDSGKVNKFYFMGMPSCSSSFCSFVRLFDTLPIHLSGYLSVWRLSFCPYICLAVCSSVSFQSVSLPAVPSVRPPVCPSVRLSVLPFVHPFVCSPIRLTACHFVHLIMSSTVFMFRYESVLLSVHVCQSMFSHCNLREFFDIFNT